MIRTSGAGWIVPILVVLVCTAASACDFGAARDALEEFDVIVELEPLQTTVTVALFDASTGNFVAGPAVLVFDGPGANSLVDMFGDPVERIEVDGGLASFGIRNAVTPSSDDPLTFRVLSSVPGYRDESAVVLLKEPGRHEVVLSLHVEGWVSPDDSIVRRTVVVADGVAIGESVLETRADAGGSSARLVVSPGARFSLLDGSPASGPVEVAFSHSHPAAGVAAVIPTGAETTVVSADGVRDLMFFAPIAVSRTSMVDAAGRPVVTVTGSIPLSARLAVGATDPRTGLEYREGDPVSLHALNAGDGAWVELPPALLTAEAGSRSGGLRASSTVPRLTEWVAWGAAPRPAACSFVLNLTHVVSSGRVIWIYSSGGVTATPMVTPFEAGAQSVTVRIPPNGTLGAYYDLGDESGAIGSWTVGESCAGPLQASFDLPERIVVDVTFELRIRGEGTGCASGALRITGAGVPAMDVRYKLAGAPDSRAVRIIGEPHWTTDAQQRITGGSMLVPGLILNRTYTFFTTIDGRRESRDILILGTTQIFDITADVVAADICAQ